MKQPAQTPLQQDYLDLIYQGRNKAYGSYELRSRYPARMKRALLLLIALLALALVFPLLGFHENTDLLPQPRLRADTLAYVHTDVIIPKKPIEVPKPAPAQNKVAAQKFTPLQVVQDEAVKTPPATLDSLKGKEISQESREGDPAGDLNSIARKGNSDGHQMEVPKPEPIKEPIRIAEQMPAPAYSVEGFLAQHLRYPESAREQGTEGKVVVEFVVAENGQIAQPRILKSGGKALDAEALRVVSLMPAWTPGRQGGKAVKVYFVLPVTFRLD